MAKDYFSEEINNSTNKKDYFSEEINQSISSPSYTYGDAFKDTAKTIGRSAVEDVIKPTFQAVAHPIQTIKGVGQAIAHPIKTSKAVFNYAVENYGTKPTYDERINQDVPAFAKMISTHPFKFVSDAATLAGVAGGFKPSNFPSSINSIKGGVSNTVQGIKNTAQTTKTMVSKIKPTIYNDAFVSDTAKSAVSKIQSKIKPLQDMYKQINEPFSNQMVDSETFTRALNVVPKSIRNDFLQEYGSQILDASGKPQTTIGNLQRMELELKDFIRQPQFGQKINAEDYNVAEAAKKLKELRLAQLPKQAQEQIKSLDKKFGPAIQASNELLPKLADKNGVLNTRFLYTTFKDPARAGMRDYLKNLKSIGIDLTPEIKNIRGWVSRQGMKSSMRRMTDKAVEGAVIGGVLRGH